MGPYLPLVAGLFDVPSVPGLAVSLLYAGLAILLCYLAGGSILCLASTFQTLQVLDFFYSQRLFTGVHLFVRGLVSASGQSVKGQSGSNPYSGSPQSPILTSYQLTVTQFPLPTPGVFILHSPFPFFLSHTGLFKYRTNVALAE